MLYFFYFLFVGSFSTPTFIIEPKNIIHQISTLRNQSAFLLSEDIKLRETPEKLKGYEKMAVDGILRFDTKIDTDGFRSGTKEISSKMLDLKIHIFNK